MRIASCLVVVIGLASSLRADDISAFDRSFLDATLRVDYLQGGDAAHEFITLDRLQRQGTWAGSRTHRIDPFEVGRTLVEIRDPGTGDLLFSRRLDSYFGEYRTTAQAARGVKRTYHASALVPFPRGKVQLLIKVRQKDRSDKTLLETEVDPEAVSREPLRDGVTVIDTHIAGDNHSKVDVAIVAEGYTKADEAKLRDDLKRFTGVLLAQEPFASKQDHFNVRGAWLPSQDQGCDEPGRGNWKATAVGASFDSLGSERYLLTEDNRALQEVAAHAPWDVLYIMVNTPRYGGGGIYNLYCTFTADNQWSPYVFLHEFGHTFAALADEYYTSSVAYTDFFPRGIEPIEPNVTALLDPSKLKWKDLVAADTPLPTPWAKKTFDEADNAYQKLREALSEKIAAASRADAPEKEIEAIKEEAEKLSREHSDKADALLEKDDFAGKVGAFEGAGYTSTGLYRPAIDCIMFSKGTKPFCPVCARAIVKVIHYYDE
ncbi:M64 family metallopeptidase [Tundrisphaera lichenicola]|uniref:M64 family metallopeptidase n=1 Tax=Tundrisphaera lichenicola TaxID=2029860 RepID=UPI003EB69ED8